jgi:hypothetical protein
MDYLVLYQDSATFRLEAWRPFSNRAEAEVFASRLDADQIMILSVQEVMDAFKYDTKVRGRRIYSNVER